MRPAKSIRREIITTTLARCCEISRLLLLGSGPEDVRNLVEEATERAFVTREDWPRA